MKKVDSQIRQNFKNLEKKRKYKLPTKKNKMKVPVKSCKKTRGQSYFN